MKKLTKEQIFVWVLVGLIAFSATGTGLLLLASPSTDTPSEDEIKALEEQLAQSGVEPLPLPEAFIPEGDVTELVIEDLVVGEGEEAQAGDTITVHYHGTLASDGSVFDSSYERGLPADLPLSGLIEGWQQGIPGMKVGGIRRLVIPSELAYGDQAAGTIPPNSDVVFKIELLAVTKQ